MRVIVKMVNCVDLWCSALSWRFLRACWIIAFFWFVFGASTLHARAEQQAAWVQFESGKTIVQGSLVRGKLTVDGRVYVMGRELLLGPDRDFVFGIGRDFTGPVTVKVVVADGVAQAIDVQVETRQYDIQRVNGVAKKYMSPDAAALKRIQNDAELVRGAREATLNRRDFAVPFVWPLKGPITGVYGSQRIFNGEPRRPHYGVDIAAPVGTVVRAPAGGVVTLAQDDLYYSGGTIILDHGYGVSSSFLHLSKVMVKKGDVLKQGQVLGQVGSAGRSTGSHLDWRMNWFDQRIDPTTVVGPMPD